MKRFGILLLCLLCMISLTSCQKCKNGHTFDGGVYMPSCGGYGYTFYLCEECGESQIVTDINITPHTFVETVTDVACGEYPTIFSHCTTCGFDTERVADAPQTHTYTSVAIQGTCQQLPGEKFTCSHCGDVYFEATPGATFQDHLWDKYYTVDKPATTTSSGEKSIHCTVSGCSARKNITVIPPIEVDFPFVPMGGQ